MKSLLIKDTTREDRIRIVEQALSSCGGACNFCNGCDNIGGGSIDELYLPYINGEKESFTEFSDHTSRMENKQIGLDWIIASVNWHIALGVNNFTSYYNFAAFSKEQIQYLNTWYGRENDDSKAQRRINYKSLPSVSVQVWEIEDSD